MNVTALIISASHKPSVVEGWYFQKQLRSASVCVFGGGGLLYANKLQLSAV